MKIKVVAAHDGDRELLNLSFKKREDAVSCAAFLAKDGITTTVVTKVDSAVRSNNFTYHLACSAEIARELQSTARGNELFWIAHAYALSPFRAIDAIAKNIRNDRHLRNVVFEKVSTRYAAPPKDE
jgi:hypothetical protein